MLDIGGWEFLIVAFVLVMVVGPKELPAMLRSFTKLTRQMRTVAREFSEGMNKIAVDAEVSEIKAAMEKARAGDLDGIAQAIDPDGDISASVKDARDVIQSDGVQMIKDMAQNSGQDLANATAETPAHETEKPTKTAGNKASEASADTKADTS
jgi:sec-independent protein translocase protein TatB